MIPPQDEAELRGPARLSPPRVSVVRLNRRLLYVVGTVLVIVVVAALVALRAQGARLPQDGNSARASHVPLSSQRWFDKVPDREPSAPLTVAATPVSSPTPTPPALPASPPAPVKTITEAELEAQRQERALRTAMAAPIAAVAFESRASAARGNGLQRSSAPMDANAAAGGSIVPAATLAASSAAAAGLSPTSRPAGPLSERPEVLSSTLRAPLSPYEVKAGTIIPAVLLTGVNSDLPGQLIGQVRESVFDTPTGQHLLIPQGARLIGLYDHQVVYGQERVLVTWKRVIFPNGTSLSLKDGMPGTDASGAAGFNDEVNHHLVRVFGSALLLSVISAGVQLSQIPEFGRGFTAPSAGNVLGASVGQQLGQTSSELIRRGTSVAPTIEVRPGYAFNVMVTQDLVFPGSYDDTARP